MWLELKIILLYADHKCQMNRAFVDMPNFHMKQGYIVALAIQW
jgi:hypothetical protein